MSSAYSTNLQLELITTGEQSGAWGSTTNNNLGTLVEQAISGYVAITYTDTDITLQMTPGASATARNMYLELDGANTTQRNLYLPANAKLYFIYNNTNYGIQVVVTGQSGGIVVPSGARMLLVCNGTNVAFAENLLNGSITGNAATATSATTAGSATTAATATTANGLNASNSYTVAGLASTGAVSDLLGNVRNIPIEGKTSAYTLIATDNGQIVSINATAAATSAYASGGALGSNTITVVSGTGIANGQGVYGASIPVGTTVTNVSGATITLSNYFSAQAAGNYSFYTLTGATLPANVFVASNTVSIYNNTPVAQTVTQGSGLTLQLAGQAIPSTGNRTLNPYGIATVVFTSATTAFITGAGVN